jgi:hypothetical protein
MSESLFFQLEEIMANNRYCGLCGGLIRYRVLYTSKIGRCPKCGITYVFSDESKEKMGISDPNDCVLNRLERVETHVKRCASALISVGVRVGMISKDQMLGGDPAINLAKTIKALETIGVIGKSDENQEG